MNGWFLILTLVSDPDTSKMALFQSEQECKQAMEDVIEMVETSNKVSKIECLQGEIAKEEHKESKWF